MMKRFLRDNAMLKMELPAVHYDMFGPVFDHLTSSSQRGALNDIMITDYVPFLKNVLTVI